MSNTPIKNITARQILDSGGNPTVEVTVEAGTNRGVFGVPSGVSKASVEAFELRDHGREFGGLGVLNAVKNINTIIAKQIRGMDVFDQKGVDKALIKLDGTPNKKKLGANATLGVSGATLKAAAAAKKMPLYKYLGSTLKRKQFKMPKIITSLIEGGLHGDTNLNLQEFLIIPRRDSTAEAIMIVAEIFHNLKKVLANRGLNTNLGIGGAYSPQVESNKQALEFISEAIKLAGYERGKDVSLGLDVAASHLFVPQDRQYILSADRTSLSSERLVSLLKEWVENFSITYLEDPLSEDDWAGWTAIRGRMPETLIMAGDDLFATQADRLRKAIVDKIANAVVIKPNQVGTISETLATIKLGQDNQYKIIVSHRAAETTDDFIADFAVGIGADFIKPGSVAFGANVVKYNRLLQIETELKN